MRGMLAALTLGLSATAGAQTPALGPEFPVNSTTSAGQQRASAALGADGTFVVTWQSMGQDGSGYGVVGRRFDAQGAPLTGELPVNTYTTDSQYLPAVASDPSGGFVVTWSSDLVDGSWIGVRARRFDDQANPLGDEFGVNTYTTEFQAFSRVATNGNGFVIVWASFPGLESSTPGQDGDSSGVFGQLYDAAGDPVGGEFQVNTYTTGNQTSPAVAMDGTGGFVVVWSSFFAQDPAASNVYGRRYDSDGNPLGGEILINAYTTGYQRDPDIAMQSSGDFVVVWHDYGASAADANVVGRRFSAAAAPVSDEFPINTYTTFDQILPRVAMAPDGHFAVTWQSFFQVDGDAADVIARRFEPDGRPRDDEFVVNAYTTQLQYNPVVALAESGQLFFCWTSDFQDGSGQGVYGRMGNLPSARPMSVDAAGGNARAGGSNLNGVLEAEEIVAVAPAWNNNSGADLALTGTASNFTGPAGPDYLLMDASADYGTIGTGSTNDCTVTGNCLSVAVSGARPTAHWDATLEEALSSGATKTWTLHVGGSFGDVPVGHPFYGFIENLFHNEITGGCGGGNFCPDNSVTRGQMAVFLLKAEHGSEYVPPPCSGTFPDVGCPGHPFADWIEQLAAEGITGGCGGGNYCPDNPVTRAQMAVFLLKTSHGSTYTPPGCAGIFGDVACPGNPFADWIEQLAAEQITGGCGGGNYCPNNPNTRGQMAVFLVKTFGLELYGD